MRTLRTGLTLVTFFQFPKLFRLAIDSEHLKWIPRRQKKLMNDKLSIPGHILKTNLSKSSSWNKNVNENIALKKKTGC